MGKQCILVWNSSLFEITSSKTKIGRSVECEIRLKDPTVSRVHAELHFDPDRQKVVLRDLESQNGTYVDGRRIGEATIHSQCEIRFGKVKFRLVWTDPDCDERGDAWEKTSTISLSDPVELTRTENVVLSLLLDGISEREAAKQLVVSFHTVHNHVRSIYRKFEVSSRAELMAFFVDSSTTEVAPKKGQVQLR
jgi:pSer/pThr/pTyr-binding forkhead associated (FHA) protein